MGPILIPIADFFSLSKRQDWKSIGPMNKMSIALLQAQLALNKEQKTL